MSMPHQQAAQDEESSLAAVSTTNNAAHAAVDFARLIGKLKRTPRTGWVRRGVPRYESVADHSWRMAALALLLQDNDDDDDDLDVYKCMALAIVHDVAEAVVGDIAPDDNVPADEKQKLEHDAMETIVASLQKATTKNSDDGNDDNQPSSSSKASRLLAHLFHEYETHTSQEAIAVKDLDLLDMIIQADEYEQLFGTDLSDFFQGTPPSRFRTLALQSIAQQVHDRREERLKARTTEKVSSSRGLAPQDAAFVQEYAQASKLRAADIESVVKALRASEASSSPPSLNP